MFGKTLPNLAFEMDWRTEAKSGQARIVLIDNGSLRPASTLSLRSIAGRLATALDAPVHPVSLLHSSKVDAEMLEGRPADTWKRFLKRSVAEDARRFFVLPLFFGPSSAIVDYLPKAFGEVVAPGRGIELAVSRTLVPIDDPEDDAVARILADLLLQRLIAANLHHAPQVILVDHGSPVAAVAACRDRVALQLEMLLGDRVSGVTAASMERREGSEYAFNEPLLERALARLDANSSSELMLSLMFVSPGRHAGPGGDIEQIVLASDWARAGRRTEICPLVGESPILVELLARRFSELVAR